MSDRQRALPSWMATKEEKKVKEKEPLKRKKKTGVSRAVFYCMNEKELVEAAMSYLLANDACGGSGLLNDQQGAECDVLNLNDSSAHVEDKAVDTIVSKKEKPSNSKEKSEQVSEDVLDFDVQEKTYVSESDTDITDAETVPYSGGPPGHRSGPAQDHAEKAEGRSQTPAGTADEDDAFRLVREIFFT